MIQIKLTEDETWILRFVLSSVFRTFRPQRGYNMGSSQVHDLCRSDIMTLAKIEDKIKAGNPPETT